MSFLNYIGEFFLFRWLFGKFKKSATEPETHTEFSGASIDRDNESVNGNYDEGIVPEDEATPVGDNLLDNYNNPEDFDDLDIFMRNNNSDNRSYLQNPDYGSDYHSCGRHNNYNDWNSGSYSQSYDDFHDEQDDYDMMDDDF